MSRWEKKQVWDIAEFLLQPWAVIIFHDAFSSFFQSLGEEVKEIMRNSKTSIAIYLQELAEGKIKSLEPRLTKQIVDIVNKKLLGFLKQYEHDLPNYKIPKLELSQEQ